MKPKFQLSKSKVLQQYNKLVPLADIISYSSKTNSIVTKILEKQSDCMFSIHFKNELKHLENKSRVLFLAQAWNKKDIKELTNLGITNFAVDNISDLDILLSFLEDNEIKINLYLRLKLKENSIRTERYFVFGINAEVINQKVRELKDHPKINQLGIHFHRKTQNMSEWNLKYEISNIIDEDVLEAVSIINIGGGLPSEYANTNVKVINSIFTKIKEFKQWLNSKQIKLMIEPGRFISAPAVKLVTKIIGINDNNIIVNASVYNSDLDALIVPVKLKVLGELDKSNGKPYVIKGVTPCSMDLFRYKVYLDNPKMGDEIIFINAGAYNFTTNFCDLDEIDTEVVE
jgi:ornithine decarboxylase